MRVDVSGGRPQRVADAPGFSGGDWNADGTIVFGSPTGIHRVPAEGGTPESVTALGDSETGHFWPRFLPDGRRFLYLVWSADAAGRALMAASLDAAESAARVMPAESNAIYARPASAGRAGVSDTGYLAFARGSAVFAQAFDERTLRITGAPVRIADSVLFDTRHGRSLFDMSANGVFAHYSDPDFAGGAQGGVEDAWEWQAVWADPSNGQVIGTVGPAGVWRGMEVSPDGTRVALHRHDAPGGDVWVIEPQGTMTRLTFEPAHDNAMPIWSPDGADIVFSARREDRWGLYRTRSDGSTDASLVHESERPIAATSWSRDGHIVFWTMDPVGRGDLWMLPAGDRPGGEGGSEPQALLTSPADERHGQVSPDGRWLAYASDATERGVYHVYVRPFPTGAGRWQVSTEPASWPRWSRDGRTLFFMTDTEEGTAPANRTLLASAVSPRDATFVYDPPRPVVGFPVVNLTHAGGPYSTYAVSPDPGRLLVLQRAFLARQLLERPRRPRSTFWRPAPTRVLEGRRRPCASCQSHSTRLTNASTDGFDRMRSCRARTYRPMVRAFRGMVESDVNIIP
jgi:Tol biopolymer transport system component